MTEKNLPERLQDNLELCLDMLRNVLGEYDAELLAQFDELREDVIVASNTRNNDTAEAASVAAAGLEKASDLLDNSSLKDATMLSRAFTVYFHLANLCEENYRVAVLKNREWEVDTRSATDPVNELTVAYKRLIDEVGVAGANELLEKLEFHPVFTAHPTEARRKAVEGKIRRIATFLDECDRTGGSERAEIDRRLHSEIDSLFRTSPIGLKKPTPVEEADTVINVFDTTLFSVIPNVYRRFDDWILGSKAGTVPPVCPAFFHPGSWVGSDRDGNPNVTAKVSRQVARKYYDHMVTKLAEATRKTATRLTVESATTPPSDEMKALWSRQKEMSERLTSRADIMSTSEPHRAAMLVMADRLEATVERDADLMYTSADDFLADLRVIQRSLAEAGAVRIAYGDIQALIWRVETFGFHMVEMEFRQHSLVHSRALEDIREHGLHGERGPLQPMTVEVLDTFRAIGWIQRRHGRKAAGRYLISFPSPLSTCATSTS